MSYDRNRNQYFRIQLELPSGQCRPLEVTGSMRIAQLKLKVWEITKVEPNLQRIFLDGIRVDDYELSAYGITSGEAAAGHTFVLKLHIYYDGQVQPYFLVEGVFDAFWHRDYRDTSTYGAVQRYRGGRPYLQPAGALRFAVKVEGKYPEATESWLGLKGTTSEETTGWPVAYHGTAELNVLDILRDGFDINKGMRFAYGRGIYCSPTPQVALGYAHLYHWHNKTYTLIIQCRVDPTALKEHGGNIWTVPDGNHIRPYAICSYEQQPGSVYHHR